MSKVKHLSRSQDPLITASLSEVLRSLGITPTAWDVLIVGDGSGSGWGTACGWAAVLEERCSGLRKFFHGSVNAGTNYLAELFPYLHAMCWYVAGPGKKFQTDLINKQVRVRPINVHIVTDAEILVKQGNGDCGRKSGRAFWAALDAYKDEGYQFFWHWMARDRTGLNILTDHLSRESRLAMARVNLPPGTTVYDFNPSAQSGG